MLDHVLDVPRGALWAGMGLGKTSTVLTMLDLLSLTDGAPALVLAPKRVALSTWPDEAAKWAHLSAVHVEPVIGTPAERRAALRRPATVYTTNYDNLPWLVEHFGERWPFRTVVADESTRLKSFRLRQGGKRAQHLARVAHSRAKRFIELTGTPSPNGLQDLWGQAWFLDRGQRLGYTFKAFTDRWFRPVRVGSDPRAVRLDPLPTAQDDIEARLRDLCLSVDARDHFDIAEPIVRNVYVDLPPDARAAYKEFERELFMSIGGTEIEAFSAAARTLKCLQMANGAVYTDAACTQWADVHDAKLDALESIVAESAGAPLLVAYHFQSDLARLQRAFPKARVLDDDPQTVRDWNAGRVPMLLAHPASCGHGLNLQDGGNTLVYFAHWWALEERMQILERIGPTRQAQAGHPRPVFIYNILAADTVDDDVIARTESKRGVQDLLLERLKRRAGA